MWSDSLKIGVDKIDEQHETLFLKVDLLIDDILDKGEYQKENIVSTIIFLKDYAITHFADEEAYQLSINDANYLKHKKLHKDFIDTVLLHEKKMIASDFAHEDVGEFAGILFAWLIYHVAGVDQKIGKTEDEPVVTGGYNNIVCANIIHECFYNVISSICEIKKDSILKVTKHNETFDGSITIKHPFTHITKGYVVFDYSASFINGLMKRLLTETPRDENKTGNFEKNFLLEISTIIIENAYQRLNVGEYRLNESEIFITGKDGTYPNERSAFDTGMGIIETGFAIS